MGDVSLPNDTKKADHRICFFYEPTQTLNEIIAFGSNKRKLLVMLKESI